MIARGLLISALMSATLLAGCAWEGGASQPVQPNGAAQASAPAQSSEIATQSVAPESPPAEPTAASPAPSSSASEALMAPVQPNDLIGSWQMVQLPPHFLQPTRPTAPFSNPWQWFIFSPMDATGVGRIGVVTRSVAPRGPVNDKILADAWAEAPMFDTYRVADGVVSVTPVAITGWSAQGTQTWRTYTVTHTGLMLGMQAIPGDVLMVLTGAQNQPLYYRMMRRVPRVQP